MAPEEKPIKRSEQLAPLSRDHHEGLMAVWKIRQGLKNGTDHRTIARFVHWFWETDLEEHFRKEEEWLLPALPAGEPMVLQTRDEHEAIEALVHINEQIADPALLEELATLIHDHIRFEERQLFPYAEKMIAAEQLHRIHENLGAEKKECPSWGEEFWKQK